jgi:hypothetical protein
VLLAPGFTATPAGERRLRLEAAGRVVTFAWMPGARLRVEAGPELCLRLSAPGGGPRLLGWLLADGWRPDAALDVLEEGGERLGVRFEPRRYLWSWPAGAPPRLLLAD